MDVIENPFIILRDSREQRPYEFRGLKADAIHQYKPLVVEWEWAGLKSGDYSIKGMEDLIQIERKSLADLHGSCSWTRGNFEKKHQALAKLKRGAVIVEASLETIAQYAPLYREKGTGEIRRSKVRPKSVYRTMLDWFIKYRVPWFTAGVPYPKGAANLEQEFAAEYWRAKRSRRFAEITTFRLLEKFWHEQHRTD